VLLLAALLYGWGLSGYANEYYSAAVRSGTESWKAFFFGSLDSASFITVDKPPMALWVQELTARVIGYGSWSLLLPEVVMGVAAVLVLYVTVRRVFGPVAGLVAALVMALTPITVAINRDNNPDTLLVLLLLLAAWACQRAVESGRLRWLVASAFFLGCGFNTKMLQAYLLLPALALVYLSFAPGGPLRRVWHLLVSGVVLAVCSFWWMIVVDLIPASSRPYVGGSTDGTVWDLVIGYNGLGRVTGNEGGGRGGPGGGQGAGFAGASGPGRLFNDVVGGQISWLLPFAALVLVVGVVTFWKRPRTDLARAALVLWGGWLVVHFVVFSFADGTMHPYYTTALAPAVGALTGIGGVLSLRAYRSSGLRREAALAEDASGAAFSEGDRRAFTGTPGTGSPPRAEGDRTVDVRRRTGGPAPGDDAVGPGVSLLAGQGRRSSAAWGSLLPLGVAVTGGWSFALLRRTPSWNPWLPWTVLTLTVLAVAGLFLAGGAVKLGRRAPAHAPARVRRGTHTTVARPGTDTTEWRPGTDTSTARPDTETTEWRPDAETSAERSADGRGQAASATAGSAPDGSSSASAAARSSSADDPASSPASPGAEPVTTSAVTGDGGSGSKPGRSKPGRSKPGRSKPGRSKLGRIAVAAAITGMVAGLAGPTAYAVSAAASTSGGSNPLAGPSGGLGMFGGPGMRGGGRLPANARRAMEGRSPGGPPQGMPPGGPGGSGAPSAPGAPTTRGTPAAPGTPGEAPGGAGGQGGFPGRGGGLPGGGGPGGEANAQLISYLQKNRGGATWLVAVSSAMSASSIIIRTGEPVMAMGGFSGGDPAMTVPKLEEYVKSGKLRFVMLGGGRPGGSSDVTSWVTGNCQAVKPSEYGGTSTSSSQRQGSQGLYRCT
jgi:4-amino-4-deoxy-L-arabinose transferase-like glycosyltransferase